MTTVTNPERHPDDLTGQRCGASYTIEALIGKGGFGEVWRARNSSLAGQEAAVKVLTKDSHANPEHLMRFQLEVHVVGKLQTNNAVKVLDAGNLPDGRFYMLMEFCDGGSLASILDENGTLSIEDTFILLAGPAQALRTAHENDIIHRDIKPDNILLVRDDDRVRSKLSDFGLAKLNRDRLHALIQTGSKVMGTPGYMAPEQLDPRAGVDRRTDIFSLGCVLYRCLTGRLPYPARNFYQYVEAVCGRIPLQPANPRSLRSDVPPDLDALVMQCIEIDRDARPASVDEVMRRFADAIPNGETLLELYGAKFVPRDTNPKAPTISQHVGPAGARFVTRSVERQRSTVRKVVVAFLVGMVLSGGVVLLASRPWARRPPTECVTSVAPLPQSRTLSESVPSSLRASSSRGSGTQEAATTTTPAPVAAEGDHGTATTTSVPQAAPAPSSSPPAQTNADKPDDGSTTKPPVANSASPTSASLPAQRSTGTDKSPDSPAPTKPLPARTPPKLAKSPTSTATDAKAQQGTLIVRVKQTWAQVWIDEDEAGTTPVRARVLAGPHRVLLVSESRRETVTVTVPGGGESVIERSW